MTNEGFWPCVSEIEIYEKQDVKLSNYNNIAAQAKITVTGGNEHPPKAPPTWWTATPALCTSSTTLP